MFSKILEKFPGYNYGNLLVLELQILIFLMLLGVILKFFVDFFLFFIFNGIIVLLFLFLLFFKIGKEFKEDFVFFAIFFGFIALLIQAIWVLHHIIEESTARIDSFFYILLIIMAFFVFYKALVGRKAIIGKVISSDGKITVVETKFDIKTFNKGGRYVIESSKKFKVGEKVKIKISSSFFGTKVGKIIE